MTNEPPTGEGEEPVEDDLPIRCDLSASDTVHTFPEMSLLEPGTISWTFGSLETGADGLARGDITMGEGHVLPPP